MLYSIIFALVIIVSIVCIIYIFSKKISFLENHFRKDENYQNLSQNNGQKINFSFRKIVNSLIRFSEHLFRWIKIFLLKADNSISRLLKKLHNLRKNTVSAPNIEDQSSEIISRAEKMNFAQLKNTAPRPQVKYDTNIMRILGEKEEKKLEIKTNNEAIVEIDNKDLYSEEECIKMISKNPRNLKAYHLLADVYLKQKNYADAKLSLQQILKIDFKNVDAKLKLRQLRDLQSKVK